MDVTDIRLSLARGLSNPEETDGVACLDELLTFVENADYPPYWSEDIAEKPTREKAFDVCKAAVIKAIVEVAGEDKNGDVLFPGSDTEKPGGEFVDRMIKWIRDYTSSDNANNREDLVVCATLSLGNVVRKGASRPPMLEAILMSPKILSRKPWFTRPSPLPPISPLYWYQVPVFK